MLKIIRIPASIKEGILITSKTSGNLVNLESASNIFFFLYGSMYINLDEHGEG